MFAQPKFKDNNVFQTLMQWMLTRYADLVKMCHECKAEIGSHPSYSMKLKGVLFRLTNFHIKIIFAIAEDDAELTEAVVCLGYAMSIVMDGADFFIVVDYHINGVCELGKGRGELDVHLGFLTEFAVLRDRMRA
jgi:hypothetical protein